MRTMWFKAVLAAALVTVFTARSHSSGGGGGYDFSTPQQYREMITLSGRTITGSGTGDVFIAGREVTLSPFKMAKYETFCLPCQRGEEGLY
jgi:hypothetical protein